MKTKLLRKIRRRFEFKEDKSKAYIMYIVFDKKTNLYHKEFELREILEWTIRTMFDYTKAYEIISNNKDRRFQRKLRADFNKIING